MASFGESGNQITSTMHEKCLIENRNYSVNKGLKWEGKVKMKEKEVGFTAMAKTIQNQKKIKSMGGQQVPHTFPPFKNRTDCRQ